MNYGQVQGINRLKSEYEIDKEKKEKEILNKAKLEREESLDEVKTMNSIMLTAKYAAIRDTQIEEKKKININKKKFEEKMYLLGEYERLKEEINRVKLEKKLNEKKLENKKELEKQIIYNKKLREEYKNMINREYEENMKHQEQIKNEEEEKIKQEKERKKKIMEEIIEANKKSFEIKKNNKLKEIKEEQELLEYNKKNI